jgi:hypothetical protein
VLADQLAVAVCAWACVAVKLIPVTFTPFTVALRLAGLNVYPVLLGVTAYVPLAKPVKV